MKKMGIVLIMIFFMVGCSSKKEEQILNPIIDESKQLDSGKFNVEEEVQIDYMIPDWILPYTELGESDTPIYLGGDRNEDQLKVLENKLKFPESNIIIVAGETYGADRKIIKNESAKVLDIINTIEKENILSEESAKNPDAKLLGHKLNIILMSVKSEYMLVEISSFDDDRHYINNVCENSENLQSVFVKSKELTQLLQDITDYKIIDFNKINTISNVTLTNSKNSVIYKCNQEERKEFNSLLRGLTHERNGLCSGPFDISIVIEADEEFIQMKWANDGCGILAVEGKCYEVTGEEQEWIDNIISEKF